MRVVQLCHIIAFVCLGLVVSACKQSNSVAPAVASQTEQATAAASPSPSPTPPRPSGEIEFTDITAQAGIRFKHNSGATGKKYLPETMGAGCAFIDYDNDGWQDIILINSTNWPNQKGKRSTLALYHNEKNGTFTDATKAAKLDIEMYGLGCAIGDFDNDGHDDIFIACMGGDYLFRNRGNGTFEDVTNRAGVSNPNFSTSAAWVDYDKDGRLDLFVCNYVDWSIEKDLFCTLDGQTKSYCKPDSYKGQSSRLYHNQGNGQFEDVTEKAGLLDNSSKSLGIALIDYDNDGWIDLFVSNDTESNKLYHNNG